MTALSSREQALAPWTYPPAPDGRTVYLVGDIHGRLDLLTGLHRRIDADRARTGAGGCSEVYLGDYIDRGKDSAGVISELLRRSRQVETIFLRGNHEQLLLDFLHGQGCLEDWLHVGGSASLLSYGVAPNLLLRTITRSATRRQLIAAMPEEHRRFYEETRIYARLGAYLAVHAGLRPGIAIEEQSVMDMLCIRREFLHYTGDLGCIVVHGHTPVMAPELRPNRINIDTGAFATNRLTCLKLDADGARILAGAASS
jgi:serine/threonine protein phosphatase 1